MSTLESPRPVTIALAWQLPLTVLLAVTATLSVGFGVQALPVLFLAAATPLLVEVDAREHRLPNWLVVPAIVIGLASAALQWATTGVLPLVPLLSGAAYPAFLLLLALLGGMGAGDVKLAAALGLASMTPPVAVLSPVVTFLAGGVVATVALVRHGRGTQIAFGPYLLAGFWAANALLALAAIS